MTRRWVARAATGAVLAVLALTAGAPAAAATRPESPGAVPAAAVPAAPPAAAVPAALRAAAVHGAMPIAAVPGALTGAAAAACAGSPSDDSQQLPIPDWPLQRLRPDLVWPLSRGQHITVAVIDSGVSPAHPKLAGRVVPGKDFVDPSSDGLCDSYGHGTMVASIIAGSDLPDPDPKITFQYPFSGMAPDATILPIKVLKNGEESTDAKVNGYIADAIRYAVSQKVDVINLSLSTVDTATLKDAVKLALDNDIVVVAAAGNNAEGGAPSYPADYDGVIAVAGVSQDGSRVSSSTTGSYVDIAGPGDNKVFGAARQGHGYVVFTNGGTSFAAPFVAGTAALIRARYPDMSAAEVARRLVLTADRPPTGTNAQVGAGMVNPYRAVTAILSDKDTVAAAPPPPLDSVAADNAANLRMRVIALSLAAVGLLVTVVLLVVVPLVRSLARALPQPPPRSARPALSVALPPVTTDPLASAAQASPTAGAPPSSRSRPPAGFPGQRAAGDPPSHSPQSLTRRR